MDIAPPWPVCVARSKTVPPTIDQAPLQSGSVSYGRGAAGALCATHRPGATHTAKARTTGSALTTTSLPRPCGLLLGGVVDHSASDHGQHRRDFLDLMGRPRQVVLVGDDEIGVEATLDRAEIVLAEEEVRVVLRVSDQCGFAADRVVV